MNLNLVFSRKYRGPEHYFSVCCMVLKKFSEIINYKPIFGQYNIFNKYKYFFFQSAFWSLFNHWQKSQSNQEQCSLCSSSPFFSWFAVHSRPAVALLFNIFSKVKRNWSFTDYFSRLFYFLWISFSKLGFEIMSSKKKETIYLSISLTNIPSWLWCLHNFVLPRWLFEPSEDWRKRNKVWGCVKVEVEVKIKIQYIKNCV